jgi:hypothetical protein
LFNGFLPTPSVIVTDIPTIYISFLFLLTSVLHMYSIYIVHIHRRKIICSGKILCPSGEAKTRAFGGYFASTRSRLDSALETSSPCGGGDWQLGITDSTVGRSVFFTNQCLCVWLSFFSLTVISDFLLNCCLRCFAVCRLFLLLFYNFTNCC